MIIFKVIRSIIQRLKNMYELSRYDDFTIENLFRKQGAIIGSSNRIMIRSLGSDPYLIKIGDHCSISNGVALITHDGGGWIFSQEFPDIQRFGKIEIKDNCYIGLNCIILPGTTIGPNAIVGAGSIVTKDVPPNTVVAGNPARAVKTIDDYKEKVLAIWEKQKPQEYMKELKKNKVYDPACVYTHKTMKKNMEVLKQHLKKISWG